MMISIRVVHFGSLGPVRRKTHFVYYGTLENSIFEKLPGTAEIICFMMSWMSVVHSVSFNILSTSALRRFRSPKCILYVLAAYKGKCIFGIMRHCQA